MLKTADLSELLALSQDAARRAGALALAHFNPGLRTSAGVSYKDGGSPVTEADLAVDRFLKEHLSQLRPDFGWLSEETADTPERLNHARIWIVDPIDGTKSFARGDDDWTIAIALVENGEPVMGCIYAPTSDEMFTAVAGQGAFLNRQRLTGSIKTNLDGARVVGPKPLVDALTNHHQGFLRTDRVHSLALRIARIAQGWADAGVAEANAHDWDLAAAHAILNEAGLVLHTREQTVPSYNRPSTRHSAIAGGPLPLVTPLTEMLQRIDLERVAHEIGQAVPH
jgi:myo-inositol-1(or 4)-monophosphatase